VLRGTTRQVEIDYEAPEPPHKQIAAWLRGRIHSGEFPLGRKIPSESDIVQETGVARSTARRAIALLREEGVIFTVQGRGSYAGKEPGKP
jgi:GntR family transcriptional regulator